MNEAKYHRALEEYGEEIVNEVVEAVKENGVAGAHQIFVDLEKYDQAHCLDLIYY